MTFPRILFALSLSASLAMPVAAQEDLSPEHAQERLRGCLLTGSSAAPRTDLRAAILSVRAFCGPQINRVRDHRVAVATQGLQGEAAKTAKERTIRALNDEIAKAIANFTGLTA